VEDVKAALVDDGGTADFEWVKRSGEQQQWTNNGCVPSRPSE